jgi:hypothetical protein
LKPIRAVIIELALALFLPYFLINRRKLRDARRLPEKGHPAGRCV